MTDWNRSLGSVVRLVAAAEPTIEPTFVGLVALLLRVVVLVVVVAFLLLAAFSSGLGQSRAVHVRYRGGDVARKAPQDGDDTLVETARVGSELFENGFREIQRIPARSSITPSVSSHLAH